MYAFEGSSREVGHFLFKVPAAVSIAILMFSVMSDQYARRS